MKSNNTFKIIVNKYYNSIYRYCFNRLKNEQDAEECTQDVFLALSEKFDKIHISEDIQWWLFNAADKEIKNSYRKSKKMLPTEPLYEDTVKINLFENNDRIEDIKILLSPSEYKLLEDYYFNGLTAEELSKMLDISVNCFHQRIHTIKLKLVNINKKQYN